MWSVRRSRSSCDISLFFATDITLVGDIIAFRNQIVHGYATVRADLFWEIVQGYLPRLHDEVVTLLAELNGPVASE